jgi:hypothetical protein
VIERVGRDVARQLKRFGPVHVLAPTVEAWPDAVGPEIARNAWPARIARDGTLHVHTKDSVWAFELTSRAEEIRARLGKSAPKRLAFAAGPLPEAPAVPSEERSRRPVRPTARHRAEADSLVRAIRDEDLRKVVAKAVAASLARAENDRSFW